MVEVLKVHNMVGKSSSSKAVMCFFQLENVIHTSKPLMSDFLSFKNTHQYKSFIPTLPDLYLAVVSVYVENVHGRSLRLMAIEINGLQNFSNVTGVNNKIALP